LFWSRIVIDFKPHLKLAHALWKDLVKPGATLIDATCGNGHDTCALAKLKPSQLFALDIQEEAVRKTEKNLKILLDSSDFEKIRFIASCHSHFPPTIFPRSVQLIVYNLGYLPGGDKELVTQVETTLLSIQKALDLVSCDGAISITCYPGHPEGEKEEQALLTFFRSLSPKKWNCLYHQWVNRPKSPSLFFIRPV
jgi:hypothetical protein